MSMALDGRDIIGQAKTGTGKTLGFGVPLLQRMEIPGGSTPQALVVCPTRELASQVASDLQIAGKDLGVRVLAVYGGRAIEPQIDALKSGIDVVVGTPGRILDLAGRRDLNLGSVRVLVMDEADEMLDMGFLPDVERIVAMLPTNRQTMLFSATMPGQIVNLARRYMSQPTHIRASDPSDESAMVDSIEQHVWRAHPMDKFELVARIMQADGRGLAMIFTRTKRKAQKIYDDLTERGFAVGTVHGDLGQGAREQALRAFRGGKIDILVATDVAARGIDVDGVTHVINFECPEDEKAYLHRVGRTGRAGNSGVAVTLVDWEDVARWQMIDRALKLPFKDPLETYSTSEHVYTGLGIPTSATGRLAKGDRTRAGLGAENLEDIGGKPPQQKPPARKSSGGRPPAKKHSTDKAPTGTSDGNSPRKKPTGKTRERRRTRSGDGA
jgi:superfamily II DNA/RNA helicase